MTNRSQLGVGLIILAAVFGLATGPENWAIWIWIVVGWSGLFIVWYEERRQK